MGGKPGFMVRRCHYLCNGRRWSHKPTTGNEIKNDALAEALQTDKLAFTLAEWREISPPLSAGWPDDVHNSLSGLKSYDDYIEAGGKYFQPAGKEITNEKLKDKYNEWQEELRFAKYGKIDPVQEQICMGMAMGIEEPDEKSPRQAPFFTVVMKDWDDFGMKHINLHDWFRQNQDFWQLVSKPNKFLAAGKVRGAVVSSLLNGDTKYDTTGTLKRLRMTMLAMQRTPAELIRDEKELQYVLDEVQKLKEGGFTSETCRDSVSTWVAFLALYKKIKAECALGIIECIASEVDVMKALGAAAPLLVIDGNMPPALLPLLNLGPGVHIREHAYAYTQRLDKELTVIKTLKEYQSRIVAIMGAAITAAFISFGNFVATYAYDTYKAGKSLPLSLIILVLVSIFGCCFLFCACTWFARRSERPSRSGYNLA